MKRIIIGILVLNCIAVTLCEEKVFSQMTSRFSSTLPAFSLMDPAGRTFTEKDFANNGVIIVVTAPILSCEETQKEWDRLLDKARPGHKGRVVFVEDMTPSIFRKKALQEMKKEYEPGKDPILLIDSEGKLRKQLGVKLKETAVLVYDRDGKLVLEECRKPNPRSAYDIWKAIE